VLAEAKAEYKDTRVAVSVGLRAHWKSLRLPAAARA
jgi:hypothetical protein